MSTPTRDPHHPSNTLRGTGQRSKSPFDTPKQHLAVEDWGCTGLIAQADGPVSVDDMQQLQQFEN